VSSGAVAAPAVVVLTGALATVPPAFTGGTTIGANLQHPANVTFGCTGIPSVDPFGRPILLPSYATSCTWFTTGRSFRSAREGTIVPSGRGRITTARVRVGPVTSPMRFVLLEALRNRADTICCRQVAQSAVFTPRRKARSGSAAPGSPGT
jgi:hypothetical protein